jgi:hypothetical protein
MARTHNRHPDSDDLSFVLSHPNGFRELSAVVPLGFFANGLASVNWEEINHPTEKNKNAEHAYLVLKVDLLLPLPLL